ncbi:hypothetical protein DFP72DRAFT_1078299, partial [Ephemerocybe angulata]
PSGDLDPSRSYSPIDLTGTPPTTAPIDLTGTPPAAAPVDLTDTPPAAALVDLTVAPSTPSVLTSRFGCRASSILNGLDGCKPFADSRFGRPANPALTAHSSAPGSSGTSGLSASPLALSSADSDASADVPQPQPLAIGTNPQPGAKANSSQASTAAANPAIEKGIPAATPTDASDAPKVLKLRIKKPVVSVSVPKSSVAAAAAAQFVKDKEARGAHHAATVAPINATPATPTTASGLPGAKPATPTPATLPATTTPSVGSEVPVDEEESAAVGEKRKRRGGRVAKPFDFKAAFAKVVNKTPRLCFSEQYMITNPTATKKELEAAWRNLSEIERIPYETMAAAEKEARRKAKQT